MLSLYLPKKLTPNFSSSWVRTILDVSLESSPSLKMSEKKIWIRYINSLAKGLSRKSEYRKIELIYLPLRPVFRHPKDQIHDPPFLLLYHAFWACTCSRNRSAVTDVLAGVGSVPARVPAQSIVALSPVVSSISYPGNGGTENKYFAIGKLKSLFSDFFNRTRNPETNFIFGFLNENPYLQRIRTDSWPRSGYEINSQWYKCPS